MKNLYERTIEDYLVQECQNYCELKKPQEGIFDEEVVPMQIYPEWKVLKVHSTKEEFDKKVFDPFCGIQKVKQTLLIQKNETKIRFKLYTYVINRGVGRKFYKKETSLKYFTYDYVKNAMYEGNIMNFHKKRKFTKKVRRVIPNANPINTIRSLISNSTFCFRSHNPNSFSNTLESVNQFVRLFLSEIPGIENYRGVSNSDFSLYKMYYDKQQVKLPNNWEVFVFSYPQPKLRKIRQNKNKYIDSIMQLHQLKGDRVRKTLHKINYFNPEPFKAICNMFGEGLVLQQSDEFLKKVFEFNSYINYCNLELPKNEKKLAFEIIKLVIESKLNFYVFEDHVRFYWHLKPLEEVKWKSKDLESFNEEHLDWTERHSFYTKGSYKRLYDQKFCEEVSKHITDANGVKYYPVLLTKSSEYNEESFNQSNCVKTYSDRASSIIISLRKDSPDSKERATLEFQLYKFKNEVICKRGQSLGRFNQKLSDDWIVPLLILDERVKQIYETNDLELPKIEVKFGHKTINANGVFSSGMVLALYESELINKPKYESPKYLNWDRSIGPGNNNHYNMPLIVPLNMEEDNLF